MRDKFPTSHSSADRKNSPEKQREAVTATLPPILTSILDAAKRLGVSRAYFYTDILPHLETVRLGSRNLVCTESIEAFVESRKQVARQSGMGA